jgi:ribosome maturation factor RimP
MISSTLIQEYLEEELERRNLFLVEVSVRPGNRIAVFIDSMQGITIDECIAVSRHLESRLDRSSEDFELEVSSPGLDKPLRLPVQFVKNTGRYLDVVKSDGIKLTGKLSGTGDDLIRLETEEMVKDPVSRKRRPEKRIYEIRYEDIKSAKVVISVKSKS